MTEQNRIESAKLARGAKWVIRQLLLELESRNTTIELHEAEQGGYVIFYKLISGEEVIVKEFARKLNVKIQDNRLEVYHGED